MPDLLSIETSSEACSVALSVGATRFHRFEHAPMKHAELLLPMVQSVLAEADIELQQLDAIAFGRGPGSFTSLRIGIGVVQGLAWGAELDVVPVSSLAAVAQRVFAQQPDSDHPVVVAMDARMEEVYWGIYRESPVGIAQPIGEEAVSPPQALIHSLPEQFRVAGNGFERYDELQPLQHEATGFFEDAWPDALAVLEMAKLQLQTQDAIPAAQAQPVYLRNKVAEKPASLKG